LQRDDADTSQAPFQVLAANPPTMTTSRSRRRPPHAAGRGSTGSGGHPLVESFGVTLTTITIAFSIGLAVTFVAW
jgi:hypothetical protein